ncbi:hypothetical protein EJ08DRAFT_307659 [Tothia fuscella]|uniref:Uncharacterized protein n=1 Tax=Tothia fuscella TaxID=1048955 RepID=A0A9P4TXK0_9PEZI|nr:hypothetical protein EJ08DRAFT_307659 [Tothia fuscella]
MAQCPGISRLVSPEYQLPHPGLLVPNFDNGEPDFIVVNTHRTRSSRGRFPIYKLPRELRDTIYKEYISFRTIPYAKTDVRKDLTSTPIFTASRTLRYEALKIYFECTKFTVFCLHDGFVMLDYIGPYGRSALREMSFSCTRRETTMPPTSREIPSSSDGDFAQHDADCVRLINSCTGLQTLDIDLAPKSLERDAEYAGGSTSFLARLGRREPTLEDLLANRAITPLLKLRGKCEISFTFGGDERTGEMFKSVEAAVKGERLWRAVYHIWGLARVRKSQENWIKLVEEVVERVKLGIGKVDGEK